MIKATIRQMHLKQLLDRGAVAVGRQYPYLLLTVYLTRLTCTSTDTQLTVIADKHTGDEDRIECGGVVCVSARALVSLVNALPDAMVELASMENNSLRVTCGEYTGTVPGVDPLSHFPQVPTIDDEHDQVAIDGHELAAMHTAVQHAVAKNKGGVIEGFHLDSRKAESLCCITTDGKRLSVAARSVGIAGCSTPGDLGRNITLPAKAATELAKCNGNCLLRITDSLLSVETGNTTMLIQLLADPYPDYRRVIPTAHPGCIVVNGRELSEVVERVDILSSCDYVTLDIASGDDNGDIKVCARNEVGEISDLVPAEVTGDPVRISLPPRQLVESLKALTRTSEDVIIKYRSENAPIVMLPCDHSGWDERIELIMPMRG